MAKEAGRPKRTLERVYKASLKQVWDMWTTKEGLESWWGPDGFVGKFHDLELRVGGRFEMTMTAVGDEQVAFLKSQGLPLSTLNTMTSTQFEPMKRFGYTTLTDFIPNVAPYEAETLVEFTEVNGGVRMVLTQYAMHSEQWTEMAMLGWKQETERIAVALAARH